MLGWEEEKAKRNVLCPMLRSVGVNVFNTVLDFSLCNKGTGIAA